MTRTLSPSDLLREGSGRFSIGARVVHATANQTLFGDAYGTIVVSTAEGTKLTPGDLVTCTVDKDAHGAHSLVSVDHHQQCPEPRGDGEVARLGNERALKLEARSRAYRAIRRYFEEQAFCEVETPVFVPSPGLDSHVHSLAAVERGSRRDFLITSPEFHMKRLLVGGMPRIYQLARCFRAEELGPWHEPEFTLLEWYRAHATWHSVVADTEAIVRSVFEAVSSRTFGEKPFDQLTVREAFTRFAHLDDAVALAASDPDGYFDLLVEKVEPGLRALPHPVFLTNYPLSQAALAQPSPHDPTTAERFELYVNGVELSNGYGELNDSVVQRERFETERQRRQAAGEPLYPLDERFLAALEEGLPRSSGNALGVDRLIALALGDSRLAPTLSFSDSER